MQEICCNEDLTDDEKESSDKCFANFSMLTENERATLVYISGYITSKKCKKLDLAAENVVRLSGE